MIKELESVPSSPGIHRCRIRSIGRAWFWQWHAPVIGLMIIGALFDVDLVRFFRELAWRAAPVLAAIAAIPNHWLLPAAGPIALVVLLLLISTELGGKSSA